MAHPIDLKLLHKRRHGLRSGGWGKDRGKTLIIAFIVRLDRLDLDLTPIVDLSGFENIGFKLDVLRVEVISANDND
jgi:hypothetical protein